METYQEKDSTIEKQVYYRIFMILCRLLSNLIESILIVLSKIKTPMVAMINKIQGTLSMSLRDQYVKILLVLKPEN